MDATAHSMAVGGGQTTARANTRHTDWSALRYIDASTRSNLARDRHGRSGVRRCINETASREQGTWLCDTRGLVAWRHADCKNNFVRDFVRNRAHNLSAGVPPGCLLPVSEMGAVAALRVGA